MTYFSRIQKNIVGFKPEMHWKIIISVTLFLCLVGIVYDVYVYTYAKRQIDTVVIGVSVPVTHATTSVHSDMEELFELYSNRGVLYNDSIKILSAHVSISPITASTTLIVATSSKQ